MRARQRKAERKRERARAPEVCISSRQRHSIHGESCASTSERTASGKSICRGQRARLSAPARARCVRARVHAARSRVCASALYILAQRHGTVARGMKIFITSPVRRLRELNLQIKSRPWNNFTFHKYMTIFISNKNVSSQWLIYGKRKDRERGYIPLASARARATLREEPPRRDIGQGAAGSILGRGSLSRAAVPSKTRADDGYIAAGGARDRRISSAISNDRRIFHDGNASSSDTPVSVSLSFSGIHPPTIDACVISDTEGNSREGR